MSTNDRRRSAPDDDVGRWSVYDEHHAAIRRYVARRVEPSAVDDLTAETFAIAWRRLPRHSDDPLPWLYGVARKVVHGHRRSHARRTALVRRLEGVGDHRVGGDPGERLADAGALAPAFATLSEKEREALALVAWEGLDHARAARAAGCSPGTFAVRLSRARRRLRAALDAAEAAPDGSADHGTTAPAVPPRSPAVRVGPNAIGPLSVPNTTPAEER